MLDFANKIIEDDMIEKQLMKEFKNKTYVKQDNDENVAKFKKIFNYYIKYEFREEILDKIVKNFLDDGEIFKNLYMSEEQLKQMHSAQMIIGSHTVDHFVLSKLSEEEQGYQIHSSFKFLENLLGNLQIKCFCYPYGGFHTFNQFTEKFLSDFGCVFSFNVESRNISLHDLQNRPQALPRYDCNEFNFGKANLG
ncbi:polysaccharide deacetylase family protein [Campylobacter taeniopygiae]|uniref:polysaccharide deacetylase family protein n=1 Tax=Campylobacter taeniopygiae TaxID=2510188 RepID=UPI001FE853D1|nr:polysaccharide deacetylase family protein [Campylobacter taeniopygiae]